MKKSRFSLIAALAFASAAFAQINNPGAPTTAGTGTSKTGTAINVLYGTTAGTATQGNDARLTTSATTLTNHGVVVGQGAAPTVATSAGTAGQCLISGGPSADPSYGACASGGLITVPSGGTGVTTLGANGVVIGQGVSAVTTTSAGTLGQVLTSNGAGVDPSFQAFVLGTGIINSGTAGQMTYYAGTGTTVSGNANATISSGALTLGVANTTLGKLIVEGNTSGAVSIIPQAAAGTYNFNLPTAAGTSGQALLSGGGGATAQSYGTLGVAAGGTGAVTLTNHGVVVGQGTSPVAITAAGTSGQPLVSGGASADPAYAVLGVVGGGTGAATLTANNVLLGNGTSALQAVAPSTSGNVLTSNGTTWSSAALPAGGHPDVQLYTSTGAFTWTKPAGATWVEVDMAGAGGGGGGGRVSTTSGNIGSAAGAGGARCRAVFPASALGSTVIGSVGTGGTGGAGVTGATVSTNGNDGGDGTASTFGANFTCAPGIHGTAAINSASVADSVAGIGYPDTSAFSGSIGGGNTASSVPGTNGGASVGGCTGGGGGGGYSSSTPRVGGNGGAMTTPATASGYNNTLAGGAGGATAGAVGSSGSHLAANTNFGGTGGGGGAGNSAAVGAAGAGGDGDLCGGGGGAGGVALAAAGQPGTTNKGGNGGNGYVFVTSW